MGCFSRDDDAKKNSKKIDEALKVDKIAYRATHRLLLLGNNIELEILSYFGFVSIYSTCHVDIDLTFLPKELL